MSYGRMVLLGDGTYHADPHPGAYIDIYTHIYIYMCLYIYIYIYIST